MEYEAVRCGPLITAAFQAHIALNVRRAGQLGPAGEDTVVELQALEVRACHSCVFIFWLLT